MISHQAPQSRNLLRRTALTVGTAMSVVVATPAIASADVPEGWQPVEDPSGLDYLLVLAVFPLGVALVIALLVSLPSMVRNRGYEPGQSWRSEPEWFGGPRKGVEAADELTPEQIESAESDRGGASGQW